LYDAGVALVEGKPFAARAPILAHVTRELRRGLPNAFVGKPPLVNHKKQLAEIRADWSAQFGLVSPSLSIMRSKSSRSRFRWESHAG
jgi:hypothetical protein